jgi:hypothetical protein
MHTELIIAQEEVTKKFEVECTRDGSKGHSLTLINYCPVDKYMRQLPVLSSGVRISRELISRMWTLRKVK